MPSPAAEAHTQAMEEKFGPINEAILENGTPNILYTHHVMAVYKQYDQLGRINAVSNNHHNANPVLARLVDHALFAMRACVEQEAINATYSRDPNLVLGELQDHHRIALELDDVSAAIAGGDYNAAATAVETFLFSALQLARENIEKIVHATHGAAGRTEQAIIEDLVSRSAVTTTEVNIRANGDVHVQTDGDMTITGNLKVD